MGILSNIFSKIFPSKATPRQPGQAPVGQAPAASTSGQQNVPPPPVRQAQQAPAQGQPQTQQQAQQQTGVTTAATGPASTLHQQVDVEEILNEMEKASGQDLNWRTSIVDLLKLLGIDSSLQARKELAAELDYQGDTGDSATMNVWLHKQVMNKLAANGGKVPADLLD